MPISNPISKTDTIQTSQISFFSGAVSSVVPNFQNEIWISLDTNMIYRAKSTVTGDLIAISGSGLAQIPYADIFSAIVVQDGKVVVTDEGVVWRNIPN